MRREEAQWIPGYLASAGDISPLVELGSSTRHFRTVVKPHIDQFRHAPLRARGIRVVHTDIKAAEGVDISGSIYERDVRARLKDVRAKAVICCEFLSISKTAPHSPIVPKPTGFEGQKVGQALFSPEQQVSEYDRLTKSFIKRPWKTGLLR